MAFPLLLIVAPSHRKKHPSCQDVMRQGARPAGGLVRGHDHALHAELLVQRVQGHERDGRGAVRVRDQLALRTLLAIDLCSRQSLPIHVEGSDPLKIL